MNRDEARKLVGGYATGSLSDAERTALFAAALDDQELFDELADEQTLKELLDEPGVRDRLIAGLAPKNEPAPWYTLLLRPWAFATGLLGVGAAIAIVWAVLPTKQLVAPPAVELAQTTAPQPGPVVAQRTVAPPTVAQPAVPQPAATQPAITQVASTPVEKDSAAVTNKARIVSAPAAGSLRADRPQADRHQVDQNRPAAAEPTAQTSTEASLQKSAQAAPVTTGVVVQSQAPLLLPATPPPAPVAPTASAFAAAPSRDERVGQLPALPSGGAAAARSGFAAGGFGRATLLPQAALGFRYQVGDASLQVTPSSTGWLSVTTTGPTPAILFSNRLVGASVPLSIPIPADAQEITVQFASQPGAVTQTPERRTALGGVVTPTDPKSSSPLVITIPARP